MIRIAQIALPGTLEAGFSNLSDSDEWGIIEVRHASNWFGVYRDFEISIDGRVVGRVGRRAPGRYRVAPGWHTLAARMDWVRTQCASIVVDSDEHAVFRCGMVSFYSRIWTVTVIMIGLLLALSAIPYGMGWVFPRLDSWRPLIFGVCSLPCLMALGVCELIVFSGMTPWSPPGRVMRLFRLPVER
jgi:hypothetical protein